MKKRLVYIFIAVLALAAALGLSACAGTSGLEFVKNGRGYEVSDFTGSSKTVRVPAAHKNKSVNSIGDWAFAGCKSIKSVNIPESVQSMGNSAFDDCAGLEKITFLGDSQLKNIGGSSFANCGKLKSIDIPLQVLDIGDNAFSVCTSLESIIFANGSWLTRIEDGAFANCTSLKSIEIPAGVKVVGWGAFLNWNATQKIYVQFASEAEADAAWGGSTWRIYCNATIEYQG